MGIKIIFSAYRAENVMNQLIGLRSDVHMAKELRAQNKIWRYFDFYRWGTLRH